MSEMNNDVMMTEEAPKKNVGCRLFAVLLLAICAAVALVLPFNAIYAVAESGVKQGTLLTIIRDMPQGGNTLFWLVPAFALPGAIGKVYTLSLYFFLVGIAGAALFALIAIFSSKNAPALVRTALFYLTAGATIFSVSFTLALKTYFATAEPSYCIMGLVLAVVGLILYFLFSSKNVGKVASLYFLQSIFSVVFIVLLALTIGESKVLNTKDADQITKFIAAVGFAVAMLNTLISIGRMAKVGCIVFDLVRYFLVMVVTLAIIAKTGAALLSILAAIIVLVQIIITIIQLSKSKKVDVEEIREEAVQQAHTGFHLEEYAEAYPYEGGPVAGVVMAEEVNPAFLPHEPHVTTAGYDFYNCKSFDPFIATLDTAERNEFTELFILKFKGTMPELPDYEVGGDNKEFFRKIFIYLGQYRDRMSQSLLTKMYQFSMKI